MPRILFLLLASLGTLLAGWISWRVASRKEVLPCPAFLSPLVEMENPIARVTRSENVVAQLGLSEGASVADIGCGPGRVTLPLARAVGPTGKVYAVDLQQPMLDQVMAKAAREELRNIEPVCGDARQQRLLSNSLDAAVANMALGEIPDYPAIFPALLASLKPGGKLLIAESRFDPHYLNREKLFRQLHAAGFVEKECRGNFLAYAALFEKPGTSQAPLPPERSSR